MTPIANRLTQFEMAATGAAAEFGLRARPSADDDRALLQRYIDTGSEEAFSQIVYRHADWIYHTCRRGLHDAHLAEDAAQAVFLLLSRKADSIKPTTHLGGWLFQACRYVVADLRKNRARYQRRQDLAHDLTAQRLSSAGRGGVSTDPALSAAVDAGIAGLRESDRQTILMHFYEGLTLRQLAAQLGITREGAKKRVMRALARLRKRLAGSVDSTCKGTLLSTAGIILLLRSHAAEAAPIDFVAAVARSATIPGFSSTFAELTAESVCRSAIRATDKLLLRLALTSVVLSLLILGTVPLRSLCKSGGQAIARYASSLANSGGQSGGTSAVAAKTPASALDDWVPGPPYRQPSEEDAAPVLQLDAVTSRAEPPRPPANPAGKLHAAPPILAGVLHVPAGTTAPPAATMALSAPPSATAHPRDLPRVFEQSVLVQVAPATVATATPRPHAFDPPGRDDPRPADPGEAHPRTDQPGAATPPRPPDGTTPGHWPDPPPFFGGTQPGAVAAAHVAYQMPDGGRYDSPFRGWPAEPWDYRALPPMRFALAGMPHAPMPLEGATAQAPSKPPANPSPRGQGRLLLVPGGGAGFAFDEDGSVPAEMEILRRFDPEVQPFAAWLAQTPLPDGLDSGDVNSTGYAFADKNAQPLFALSAARPLYIVGDTVVVPEPAGGIGILLLLFALATRRRR
ncbi:MAG: sigma-70 family RNA polymerase sigma factor [Tepidisphaerales bacterium]